MNATETAYRKTAVEGTSGFGLLIALYDTLAGDLRRAAQAQRRNDIQTRCREINHALLVIGYLEDWIDRESEGVLSQKLAMLYKGLRKILIEAQVKQSAEMIEQQMELILEIRGTWQELEMRASSVVEATPGAGTESYPGPPPMLEERAGLSWSA